MTTPMTTPLQQLIDGYIEAVYFTETGDTGQPESCAELSASTKLEIKRVCARFYGAYVELLAHCGASWEQVGHDLHLTRQGFGAGFWDRNEDFYPEEVREELIRACQLLGEIDAFVFEEDILESVEGAHTFDALIGEDFLKSQEA